MAGNLNGGYYLARLAKDEGARAHLFVASHSLKL
jgi:hypothetical protein